VGQKGLKLLHLWYHSPKSKTQNPKSFFIADSNTCQVFWGFEQLFSAISRGAMDLQRHMQTALFRPVWRC